MGGDLDRILKSDENNHEIKNSEIKEVVLEGGIFKFEKSVEFKTTKNVLYSYVVQEGKEFDNLKSIVNSVFREKIKTG